VDESEITGYVSANVIWVVALVSAQINFKIHTNRGRVDHFGWQATLLGNQPSFLIVPCLILDPKTSALSENACVDNKGIKTLRTGTLKLPTGWFGQGHNNSQEVS